MKKTPTTDSDIDFSELFGDAKRVTTDKIRHEIKPKSKKSARVKQLESQAKTKQRMASFEFSDAFEGYFDSGDSASSKRSFIREDVSKVQFKALKRGDLLPELILDLHGLNKEQAKNEIAALLDEAYRLHYECVNIIHGVSGGVLRKQVPNWLIQHPYVQAFHQAPLEWGGNGALLVLIKTRQFDKPF